MPKALKISDELHRRLKIQAAVEGLRLGALIERLLDDGLAERRYRLAAAPEPAPAPKSDGLSWD